MLSFGRQTFRASKQVRPLMRSAKTLMATPQRSFGAMDEINRDLFEHKFTSEMQF